MNFWRVLFLAACLLACLFAAVGLIALGIEVWRYFGEWKKLKSKTHLDTVLAKPRIT